MPIHLPPISRREFLARAAVAATGLALAPELSAARRDTEANAWALLADIHIAANPAFKDRGVNMTDHFLGVSKELLGLPKRPAGLFITGDCAYGTGEKADYAHVVELLRPIRQDQVPIHIALGNHDQREHFRAAPLGEPGAKGAPADKQVALLRTARAHWYLLDSLEKTAATPGLLGREQLDWLARSLDANPGKPALILAHHQPGAGGNMTGLKDSEALFEVIRPRTQVKAYIFGHTHAWKVEQDASGIHLVNLPPVAYVFYEGAPAGWVSATVGEAGMALELRCLDRAHKAHGQTLSLAWRK